MIGYVVFSGSVLVAEGSALDIARALSGQEAAPNPLLVFDLETGAALDLDLSGDEGQVAARYGGERGRGRPRLGVVSREVTLLPRHWDWLSQQRGGASAALRRLVDAARGADGGASQAAQAKDAAYRILSGVAGDWPRFEAAARALYADDLAGFRAATADWPGDVVAVALARLARNNDALSA